MFPYSFGTSVSGIARLDAALSANFVKAATEEWTTSAIDAAVAGVVAGMVTAHSSLTGLSADDHPQYHNDARGDARYYTQAQVDTAIAGRASDAELAALQAEVDADEAALATHRTSADHDSRYYTEAETDALIAGRASDAELASLQSEVDTHEALTTTAHGGFYNVAAVDALIAGRASDAELAALQSEVDADEAALAAHLADTTGAHYASAISIVDAGGNFTATEVEGALAEAKDYAEGTQTLANAVDTNLSNHLADGTDAHDASAISVLDTAGNFAGGDVEAVLAELAGTTTSWSETSGTPTGGIDGDWAFDPATGIIYQKVAGVWGAETQLTDGVNGTDGSQIFSDTSAPPAAGTSVDGDWCFIVSGANVGEVYQKQAGSWALMFDTTGPAGANGTDGVDANGGLTYTYDSTVTMSDPGAGYMRMTGTEMVIDPVDAFSNNVASFLDTWDDSTGSVKGHVVVKDSLDSSKLRIGTILTCAVQGGGTHYKLAFSAVVNGATSFVNGDTVTIVFVRAGDTGATGATGAAGADGTAATNAHIADTTAAHAASAISADSTTLVGTGADVQAVLEELDNAIVATETVANAAVAKTLFDAKGDLVGCSAADTPVRIAAAASNGSVLTSDTSSTGGVKWKLSGDVASGYASTTTASTATAVTNQLSITVTGDGTNPMWVEGYIPIVILNTVGDRARVAILDGSTVMQATYRKCVSASVETGEAFVRIRIAAFSGSKTFHLTTSRDVGSGTCTWYADANSVMWLSARWS